MTEHHTASPIIFGEVLFDCFPNGDERLGGAPFNVAWHLQAFGCAPTFISRVGTDDLGNTIKSAMQSWGMDFSALQTDTELPSGRVDVSIADDGDPSYTICHPVAYDRIHADALPDMQAPAILYHGSLALRSATSRAALQALKDKYQAPVFVDVNLRAPWWQKHEVLDLIATADWVKLNQDELEALGDTRGSFAERTRKWIDQYNLKGVILTMGANGARIITKTECLVVSPPTVKNPIDPVGAGDAFSAVFILGVLRNWELIQTLVRAQDFAAKIVEQRGAIAMDRQLYKDVLHTWGEDSTS